MPPRAGAAALSGSPISAALEATAWLLLAGLPLAMAIANKSAPLITVVAALMAVGARVAAGDLSTIAVSLRETCGRPAGYLAAALALYAVVSLGWSHALPASARAFGELALVAAAGLLLHAALPKRAPGWFVKVLVIATALGCLSMIAELATGMAMRTSLGIRNYPFIFKRSVTAILIVIWPMATLLWLHGKRSVAALLPVLLGLAAAAAHSSAALMGLAVGVVVFGLALLSRRWTAIGLAAGFVAALAIAPVLGDTMARLLPERVVDRLDFAHADQRIEVWQSFGEVVRRRPIAGTGFGTSSSMARDPVAAEIPEARREMLGAWHAHDGYLQVWTELGAIGALLIGALLVTLCVGIARSTRAIGAASAATLASGGAIMLVGHGIWQGWWIAMIAAAAILLARLPAGQAVPPRKPVAAT